MVVPAQRHTAVAMTRLPAVVAQQSERPGNSLDHPIDVPRDFSGLSLKNPRVRVVRNILGVQFFL